MSRSRARVEPTRGERLLTWQTADATAGFFLLSTLKRVNAPLSDTLWCL